MDKILIKFKKKIMVGKIHSPKHNLLFKPAKVEIKYTTPKWLTGSEKGEIIQ